MSGSFGLLSSESYISCCLRAGVEVWGVNDLGFPLPLPLPLKPDDLATAGGDVEGLGRAGGVSGSLSEE